MNIFDIIGPVMVGPSSSHTAGTAAIAYLAQKMINGTLKKVEFTLYGSFAQTYRGHGTDRALLGGILGLVMLVVLAVLNAGYLLTPVNVLLYGLIWMIPGLLITEWTRQL